MEKAILMLQKVIPLMSLQEIKIALGAEEHAN